MELRFDRSLEVPPGILVPLSPLVARLLAPNPGPFTFKGTGVHLVGAGPEVAVIDPGPAIPAHIAALKAAIGARKLTHILVTHTHADHSPAAAALKQWSGARTYALAGAPPPARGEGLLDEAHDHDFVPDIAVRDGALIGGDGFLLECVVTPGHTANHLCYGLVQEKALFTGDHVMGWSTSVIAPPDGEMGAYLASLERLKARDDAIFYPTHGSPIADPRAWLEGLTAHRRMREAQILAGLKRGDDSVVQLVTRLYPALDPALQGAAGAQVLAHLEHLARKGAVEAADGSWRLRNETP